MTGLEPVTGIGGLPGVTPLPHPGAAGATAAGSPASFSDLVTGGLRQVDQRVATADALVRSFALDDNVPLHQVTFALEQARLSVELAMQVQSRLVEGYRQLMNMQL